MENTAIYEKNIALFKRRFPNVPTADDGARVYETLVARNGSITARDNGILLHSLYNPEREAQKLVSDTDKPSAIFLGFGLGYGPIAWANKEAVNSGQETGGSEKCTSGGQGEIASSRGEGNSGQDTQSGALILIESDRARFFASLHVLDWSQVFAIPRLIIALECPAEKIIALIASTASINDCAVFAVKSHIAHDVSYFNAVAALIERNKRKEKINAATTKRFAKRWVTNICLNVKSIASNAVPHIAPLAANSAPPVTNSVPAASNCLSSTTSNLIHAANSLPSTANSFSPAPNCLSATANNLPSVGRYPIATILAAGPSLEAVLPRLKEIKRHSLVIAVDTALRASLRAGVEPDYIVLTDPQYYAWRHIAGLRSPSSILVTELDAYPAVFRFDCRTVLLCQSPIPLAQRFERRMSLSPASLGAGGSVASCAWNLAYLLGAKSIYLAGLDLSFPRGETHVRGSAAEEASHAASYRLCTAENASVPRLIEGISERGKDYNGDEVATDSRMLMFAWWFESRLAEVAALDSTIKTYTLCPTGLFIPGIMTASIDTILKSDMIERGSDGKVEASAVKTAAVRKIATKGNEAEAVEAGEQAEATEAATDGTECGAVESGENTQHRLRASRAAHNAPAVSSGCERAAKEAEQMLRKIKSGELDPAEAVGAPL